MQPRPYSISVAQQALDDLQLRLRRARLPPALGTASGWEHGTSRAFLQELIAYWQEGFDWRKQEARLNSLPQFLADDLHFIHLRASDPDATPLLLLHGWPDSCFRYSKVIPKLAEHYHVVVPSYPGFPLSGPVTGEPRQLNRSTAGRIHKLMVEVLGYSRFVAAGGDGGSPIAQILAIDHPDNVLALHLTDLGWHAGGVNPDEVSRAERKFLEHSQQAFMKDGAYAMVQGTQPRSLSPSLNDSPVALASWIVDRFHSWSDNGGDLTESFSKDELLTDIMLYWVTQTIGSSIFSYYAETHSPSLTPRDHVDKPAGMALFPKETGGIPPRAFAERTLNIQHWTEMPRGSHFAPLEDPELYAGDLIETIRALVER